MVEIDGTIDSGEGQILRTACALSALTKKPCRIFNIHNSQLKPGLSAQHLLEIEALAHLSNGRIEGGFLDSKEIKFWPGENYKDKVFIKIPAAESITLALQLLIPPALFSSHPLKIIFNGGATDTFFSPTIDYFRYVFLKFLGKMEGKIEVNILKRGYYPEGGANVEVKIYPSELKKINLTERGPLKNISIISGASNLLKDKKIAERQLMGTREVLGKLNLPIKEKVEYYQTQCPGSQICLIGEFEHTVIGVDGLGKLGKRAEDTGQETALELLKEQKSRTCLDKNSINQVMPYLALSKAKSSITVSEITNHCEISARVIEKFLEGRFEIKNNLISWIPK